jgi:hypothetical protein
VELVEHDGTELRKEWILLEARRQHAFGGHQQSRLRTETPLESNLPADLAAYGPPPLVSDALGDGAGRDTPRLQQDQGAVGGKRRRHARRLARARLCRDDNGTRSPKTIGDRIDERIDRKGFEARGSWLGDVAAYAVVTPTPTGQVTPVPPSPQ